MNTEFKDYYKVLGVTPRATLENIRKAAERELGQNWNNAIGRLEIQEAYETLANPEKRKEYDLEFNRRLNERELAIRNARTFEEYIAATSLHSELANVDVAPEVTVPQEELPTQSNEEKQSENLETKEQAVQAAQEEPQLDNTVSEGINQTDSESVEQQEEQKEQEQQEQQEEQKEQEQQEQEQEKEQEQKEQEQEQEQEKQEQKPEEEKQQETQTVQKEEGVQQETQSNQDEHQIPKNPIKIDVNEAELEKKRFNRKQIGKGAAIILGSTLFFGPVGTVVSSIIVKKSGKFALQKIEKSGILKDVKNRESELIQDYNKSLENEIIQLLNKPLKSELDNYKLEIAKLRYQNNLDLLTQRIEFKKNEVDKLGMKAHNRLHLLALKTALNASVLWLEIRKKKAEKKNEVLDNYSPKQTDDKLSKLYEEIGEKTEELSDEEMSKAKRDRQILKIKRLNAKKLNMIDDMKLKRNGISRKQLFLAAVNSMTHRKKTEVQQEEIQEQNGKTL